MLTGHNIIGGKKSAEGNHAFFAFSTRQGKQLEQPFIEATEDELEAAAALALKAFESYSKTSGIDRALFLQTIASEILQLGDSLIQQAMMETGLPEARLVGERARTLGQLELFAELLKEGSWVDAIIDESLPERKPLPRPDLRRMNVPLGPVAVYGAANFPLAFSTAGGDTVSALASGCPVIFKAHPSHPGTNEMVANAIILAAEKTNMPEGVFSSLNGGVEISEKLAIHPSIKAIGFTGSRKAGMNLFHLACNRSQPIPVFAEMSSINPVLILPEKLSGDNEQLAQMLAVSITQGAGQFCTNPGLMIMIDDGNVGKFLENLSSLLEKSAPQWMLNPAICNNYYSRLKDLDPHALIKVSDNTDNYQSSAGLIKITSGEFLHDKRFQEEIFGPVSIAVICHSKEEMLQVIQSLEGQLTGTVMGENSELSSYRDCINALQEKVGRLLFNGVPTGVEVTHSMVHGGPFPSTTNASSTSVGTEAIKRFTRPVCFQDCPDELLPDALKQSNPLHILRKINGHYTR
jgi:2,5-dioxopentanoate dehydrogenase